MAKTLTLFLLFLELTYFTAFAEEEFDIGGGGSGFRMPFIKPPSSLRPLLRHKPPVKDNPPPINPANVNPPAPFKPSPDPELVHYSRPGPINALAHVNPRNV